MARAVLFDLDGTLYHQGPLRAAMAVELGLMPVRGCSPRDVRTLLNVLRTFRRVREELRAPGPEDLLLEDAQYAATAERARVDPSLVRRLVSEWMFRRPLRYLAASRRAGVASAFEWLRRERIPIGVFSDYPTEAKIDALGLAPYVAQHICATDALVNAFKPDPRGFLVACQRWDLSPDAVVYVGDRPEVDAAGAEAAGMPCLIVGRRSHRGPHPYVPLPSFRRLEATLRQLDSAKPLAAASAEGNR